MSNSELEALINLLDDPDGGVYKEVKNKLISLGDEVIPHLENAWESSFDHLLQERIEDIIHFLQFDTIRKALVIWQESDEKDLIDAAIIIAKYQYPDLEGEKIKSYIDQLVQDVWLELNDNLTALEQVKVLNRIIFDIHGFTGNKKNINSPKNSYINNVIETKKGNPITLSIIYLAVCKKLEIPFYGVNVPEHFVLAYSEFSPEVLFYLNVFNRGFVFSSQDIDKYLDQLEIDPKEEHYAPCNNLEVIKRLLQHLVYTYDNLGYLDKKDELMELLAILENS